MPLPVAPKIHDSWPDFRFNAVLALLGWTLFSIVVLILLMSGGSPLNENEIEMITQLLLKPAGWFLTASWILGRIESLPKRRWTLFRWFQLLDAVEAFLAPVTIPAAAAAHRASVAIHRTYDAMTRTTERRIGFGAIIGFVALYLFAALANAI